MKNPMKHVASITVLIILCAAVFVPSTGQSKSATTRATRTVAPPDPIVPVPDVQKRLDHLAKAQGLADFLSRAADVIVLLEDKTVDEKQWLRQVLHHVANNPRRAAPPPPVAAVVRYAGLDAWLVLVELEPYLHSRDEKVRQAAEELLVWADVVAIGKGYEQLSEFVHVGHLLGPPLPAADLQPFLIRSMYRQNPTAALFTMLNAYLSNDAEGRRKIIWAEHRIAHQQWLRLHKIRYHFQSPDPEAEEAILELSRSEHWWVRLYVAHTIERYKELRQPEPLKLLKNDPHPLVAEVVLDLEPTTTNSKE